MYEKQLGRIENSFFIFSKSINTYSSFLSLIGITAFNINNHQSIFGIDAIPDAFGCLTYSFFTVEFIKGCTEECIQQGTFPRALRSNDRNRMIAFLQRYDIFLG